MDDNLNEQPATDDQAAMEAAFAAGFDDELESPLPSLQEPAKAQPTAEPAGDQEPQEPAQEPAKEQESAPPADPYEGLPEPVKRALAAIPALETELRRTTGQVRALQSAHDRAAAAAQAAAEVAPRSAAHEQVAETLPEVLATIEEVVAQRLKQHAQTPAPEPQQQDTRLPDEIRLDEGFPQWRQIASSNDFKMWAAVQEDARTIQSTQDMVTFMGAITRFQAHQAARVAVQQEAERQAALRNSRIDASLTPARGAPRRPASTPQTAEEGFNSVWD